MIAGFPCVVDGQRAHLSFLLGTITDFIQQERPERPEPAQDSPDAWRAYHTRPAEVFFEEWKEKYRMLEWAPLIENADDGVMFCYDAHSEVSSKPSLCWGRMGSIHQS